MKISAKTGRSIRPPRSPVLAIRIPAPVYGEIKKAAKTAGMTLSEYVAQLITRGQEWQETIGEARRLLAESKRIIDDNLKAEMRRQGWVPLHGSPYWLPPGAVPTSGFINAEVLKLEQMIAALKAVEPEKDEPEKELTS
jgi:hypothetical protein